MTEEFLAEIRNLIRDRLAALDREDARGQEGQGTVELDQQSVGRLSRMDALQSQAMAKGLQGRRDAERRGLRAALERLEASEYGYCEDCGDEIVPGRLRANPMVTRCMSCAGG